MIQLVDHNSPMIIRGDQLIVEIANPGSIYTGTRFDWSGFITQVTRTDSNGQHTYCVPESLEPGKGTGGLGLCNEFGNDKPIGYDEIKPGDLFPKLGIGLLKRPDLPKYSCFYDYEIVHKFPIHITQSEDQLEFTMEPVKCHGYAVRLTKTLTVHENWLDIASKLENVGDKLIDTNEYYHNFTGIDNQLIGPDYIMHFPYQIKPEKPNQGDEAPGNISVVIKGSDLTFPTMPTAPFYYRIQGFSGSKVYQWELNHLPSNVRMREYDDFPPSRVVVWGSTHVISTEIYVDISLSPGQEKVWKRSYEFLVQ